MSDEKHIPVRCEEDDPNRCQGMAQGDQCRFLSIPGEKFCVIHTKHRDQTAKALYEFNKTEVLSRIASFRGHGDSKTLAIELGLLRLLLEQAVNKCEGPYDLLTNSVQLSALISQIKELQLANVKLEEKVGDLLSLEQVIEIAQKLYAIVVENLASLTPESFQVEETLGKIAEAFEEVLLDD